MSAASDVNGLPQRAVHSRLERGHGLGPPLVRPEVMFFPRAGRDLQRLAANGLQAVQGAFARPSQERYHRLLAHLGSTRRGPPSAEQRAFDQKMRLLAMVFLEPGCTKKEASAATGMRHEALLRHLAPLSEAGHVIATADGPQDRLFPGRPDLQAPLCRAQFVTLRDSLSAALHTLLLEGPLDGRALSRKAVALGLTHTGLFRRLKKLEKAGLLQRTRHASLRIWTYRGLPVKPAVADTVRTAEQITPEFLRRLLDSSARIEVPFRSDFHTSR